MQSLISQLESLNVKNIFAKVVPASTNPDQVEMPKDALQAKRKQREQAEALKREEERKANVEAALQRLR